MHIRYQMKGLDELSWKMSKKFFFDARRPCWGLKWPLKCIKTAFTARKNSSPIFKIHVYMLYQNDHNNISPAKTERIFYILPLVIFYAPRFLAVSIFHVIWYWEVPFDPQTIEKVKKALCLGGRNFVVIILVYHTSMYLQNWRRVFAGATVR